MNTHCKDCGRGLEGDGVTTVLHCPVAHQEFWKDVKEDLEDPVYCEEYVYEHERSWCY